VIRFVLPALVWTLVVTILTLLPGKDLPQVNVVNFDKFAHLGVFFLMNFLYLRWKKFGPNLKPSALIITLFIIAYSGLIELLQGTFYTDRFADWFDFFANATGAGIAYLTFPVISNLKR
jgi:VanZ family protein